MMFRQVRSLLAVLGLVAFEFVAIAALHHLGSIDFLRIPWRSMGTWIQVNPAEDTLAAFLRLIGLATAYWMAASTVLYGLARATRVPGAIRAVRWATLPAVRRVIDRGIAVSLAAATVAGPALPAVAQQPPPVVREHTATETVVSVPVLIPPVIPYQPTPAGVGPAPEEVVGAQSPRRYTPSPAGVPEEPKRLGFRRTARAETLHEVVRGEHMWSIAADHSSAAAGQLDPTEREIASYWLQVIAANRDRIRSGNPDLIYPGETLVLPPLDSIQEDT